MTFSPARTQRWFPARTWTRESVVIAAGTLMIAVFAQASIRLPFVPITGQTLGVMLVAGWAGFGRGVSSVALYIALGACGLPVFAHGMGGPHVLIGPTAGYLIGFLVAAGMIGLLAEHGFLRGYATTFVTLLAANAAIFAFGIAWLAAYVPKETLFATGFWPFLPGELAKIAIAVVFLRSR